MAVQYEVDSANRIVKTTFTGIVEHQDPTAYAIRLRTDPAFDPGFSEVISFESWSELRLSRDFRNDLDPFSKVSKCAIVVGENRTLYGIARMWQTARDDRNVSIFTGRKQRRGCQINPLLHRKNDGKARRISWPLIPQEKIRRAEV
jgi:hypothetical protein